MSTQTIRVKAAIVDKEHITIWDEEGKRTLIPQGDPRIQIIVDQVIPVVNRGEVAVVSLEQENVYDDFEKKTNGFVRFFRVAKHKLAQLFTTEVSDMPEPGVYGTVPKDEDTKLAAVNDIIASATPATSAAFKDIPMGDHDNNDTIIAVTKDNKVIPAVQNLKGQLEHAMKLGSEQGVKRFMERCAAVAQYRNHSVEDLLKFMERGDLPIADDGSIIIYKVLKKGPDGRFLDCHSRKVSQKVGSYVCMDPKLVDHNRRNECSNGLHVARRGYIRNFSGDLCVLAKVAPEDVIAVPQYDANKMRVCGYHILFLLTPEMYSRLNANQPMTSIPEAQEMLGKAIAGKHIGKIERVQITEQMGGGVIITPLSGTADERITGEHLITTENEGSSYKAEALPEPAAEGQPRNQAKPVDPTAVHKAVQAQAAPAPSARQVAAREDLLIIMDRSTSVQYRKAAANRLVELKKKSKVSWEKLGLQPDPSTVIKTTLELPDEPKPAPKAKAPEPVKKVVITKDVTVKPVQPGRNEIANDQFLLATSKTASIPARKAAASNLLDMKRKAKVSWTKLGLGENTGKVLEDVVLLKTPIEQQKAKPAPAPKEGIAVTKTVNDTDKVYLLNTRGEYSLGGTKGCTPDITKAHVYEYQEVKHLLSQGMRIQLIPAEQSQAKKSEKKRTPKQASKPNGTSNSRNSIDQGSSSVVAKGAVTRSEVKQNEDKATAEAGLTQLQRDALVAVRGGATVTQAAKKTGVSRRSIDRLIAKFGK